MLIKYGIGIDVSSDSFYVCFSRIDTSMHVKISGSRKFSNTPGGFKDFWAWSEKHRKDKEIPLVFCMEASGVYHEQLAFFLNGKQQDVCILLPNKAKKYIESMGFKTKNDKSDAKALAQMACERNLKLWKPPAKFYAELREMTRHHQSCQETITSMKNHLHANQVKHDPSPLVIRQLKQTIRLMEKQAKEMEKKIAEHIASDEQIQAKFDHICAIKGVATLTVATILAETFGFELFENAKQLVSYAGYDVVENQSGKRAGKTKISKKGNSRIRRILHLPAFNVVRPDQPAFYNFFHRNIQKHHIKMKSYVAVQRKLLTTIYALWKTNVPFDPNYRPAGTQKNSPGIAGTKVGTVAYEMPELSFNIKCKIYGENVWKLR